MTKGPEILERDPTTGQITRATLSPEQAREMQKKKTAKERFKKRTAAEKLLAEAGYKDPAKAPASLVVLAEMAAKEGRGSVTALREFIRVTREDATQEDATRTNSPQPHKPDPGDICPTCGQLYLYDLPVSLLQDIRVVIKAHQEAQQPPAPQPPAAPGAPGTLSIQKAPS